MLGKGCLKQKPIYLPEGDIQSIYMRDFKISQTVMNYEILINAFLQCLIRNLTWMLTFYFFFNDYGICMLVFGFDSQCVGFSLWAAAPTALGLVVWKQHSGGRQWRKLLSL